MKHAIALGCLPLLATIAVACGEKIIIVHDGPGPQQRAGASSGQIASGEPNGDPDAPWGITDRADPVEYSRTVDRVVNMVNDGDLTSRVARRGLSVVNVAWEDTGRNQGSSVGPNISDLSLQVRERGGRSNTAGYANPYNASWSGEYRSSVLPVIRQPNFSDKSADIPADKFFVRVGNERGQSLRTVPLTEMLSNLRSYVSLPSSISGDANLLASRDTHFLVSAQAVFLPIPKTGKAEFNPVLFNYQSSPNHPAVLTILVTRQGTSVAVIENRGEDATGAGWGQELYFNANGQRSALTAERKSDVVARIESQGGPKTEDDKTAIARGADLLFLIQVPLVYARPRPHHVYYDSVGSGSDGYAPSGAAAGPTPTMAPPAKAAPFQSPKSEASADKRRSAPRDEESDMEQAVLGHGPNLGPVSEGRNLRLTRDTRFPIRVTVQFYKATSNGVISDVDLDGIAKSLGSVYEHADYVGSLVVPDGDPRRPTAWQRPMPREWFPW